MPIGDLNSLLYFPLKISYKMRFTIIIAKVIIIIRVIKIFLNLISDIKG